ncbi:hypothetical protein ABZT51_30730 [Streptomyces sp. NPDC005373]|uniref:hypothetical protein n=1 Tax=Streptomyces sp. NPDC005373 TaxID=3156879 RepID=UPI00339E9A10
MTRAARHRSYAMVHERKSGRSFCAALAVTVLAATALTACSTHDDGSKDGKSPSPAAHSANSSSPSATASPSPSESGPKGEVEAAYRHYWDEMVDAYAQASTKGTDFKKYAVAQAYATADAELKILAKKGYVSTGRPSIDPRITKVDTSRKTARSTFTDCVDITKWNLVKKSTGSAVKLPGDRLTRYISKVTAEKWYGHWVIVKVEQEARSC